MFLASHRHLHSGFKIFRHWMEVAGGSIVQHPQAQLVSKGFLGRLLVWGDNRFLFFFYRLRKYSPLTSQDDEVDSDIEVSAGSQRLKSKKMYGNLSYSVIPLYQGIGNGLIGRTSFYGGEFHLHFGGTFSWSFPFLDVWWGWNHSSWYNGRGWGREQWRLSQDRWILLDPGTPKPTSFKFLEMVISKHFPFFL